jgi:hypothetical protein
MEPKNELEAIRASLGVTQPVFSQLMGVPLRTYEDLAAGKAAVRDVHVAAARYAALRFAAQTTIPWEKLPEEVRTILFRLRNTIPRPEFGKSITIGS